MYETTIFIYVDNFIKYVMLKTTTYLTRLYQLYLLRRPDYASFVNEALESTWKEVVVAHFKALFRYLVGRTKGNSRKNLPLEQFLMNWSIHSCVV
jgi:hypothetical protein